METERLVNRYGRNRLDAGAFNSDEPREVITRLQEMTVLAEVDHQTIEGERLTLSPAELRQIEERHLPWLPESVEQRIAESAIRTQAIVDAYMSQVRAIDGEAPDANLRDLGGALQDRRSHAEARRCRGTSGERGD